MIQPNKISEKEDSIIKEIWEQDLRSSETGRVKGRDILVVLCSILNIKVTSAYNDSRINEI